MRKGYFITSEESADNFVGIRFREGIPEVVFPHGFNLSDSETECRRDVFRLLSVLKQFTDHREGEISGTKKGSLLNLPLSSYQYIIHDFFVHGYYSEKEVRYSQAQKGKINWKRTIQKESPKFDKNNVVYLNFQVKANQINTDNLLTEIHRYCVYKSFFLFGWLYMTSAYLPPKVSLKGSRKLFLSVLHQALNKTFIDSQKKLFQSMINILLAENDDIDIKNCSIGVNRFEGVWERLIDHVFGESNKTKYFPHATWHIIKDGKIEHSSALEPDTIMKYNNKIYVLDAKYYQYGITFSPKDLPNTSSIQKQITYGKYIAEQIDGIQKENVYNAFIMPFNAANGEKAKFVSVGTADWETYSAKTMNYAYVLGILLDTKWMIAEYTKHNDTEIERLADLIEESLVSYKHNCELLLDR